MAVTVSSPESVEAGLDPFQRECVQFFVHAAQALSIPRSVGEIFGLLFASREMLTMDEVIGRLHISKGSASQGLRWLRDMGAVRTVYRAGDRRDRFEAEVELRKLAYGFLRESVEPHLHRGTDHLERLQAVSTELPPGDGRKFAEARTKKLRRWHRFATQTLPMILRIAEKF